MKNEIVKKVNSFDPTKSKHYKLRLLKSIYMEPDKGIFCLRYQNIRISIIHLKQDKGVNLILQTVSRNEITPDLPGYILNALNVFWQSNVWRRWVYYTEHSFTFPDKYLFGFLTAMQMAVSQSLFKNPYYHD